MGLQEICEGAVQETEGALGCLLIDQSTGIPLAVAYRKGMEPDASSIRSMVRNGENLFRGKLLTQYVKALKGDRSSSRGYVQEVQITTAYTYQFMATLPEWDDGLIIFVTEKEVTLGLGWLAVHQVREQFTGSLPRDQLSAVRDRQPVSMPKPRMGSPDHPPAQPKPVARTLGSRTLLPDRSEREASEPERAAQPVSRPASATQRQASATQRQLGEAPAAKFARRPALRPKPPAAPAESEAPSEPESEQVVAFGPRANMFRSRNERKKRR